MLGRCHCPCSHFSTFIYAASSADCAASSFTLAVSAPSALTSVASSSLFSTLSDVFSTAFLGVLRGFLVGGSALSSPTRSSALAELLRFFGVGLALGFATSAALSPSWTVACSCSPMKLPLIVTTSPSFCRYRLNRLRLLSRGWLAHAWQQRQQYQELQVRLPDDSASSTSR